MDLFFNGIDEKKWEVLATTNMVTLIQDLIKYKRSFSPTKQ